MEENKEGMPVVDIQSKPNNAFARKRFPTLGDLFAMLGIMLGAQILLGMGLLIAALALGVGPDIKSLDPKVLGRLMAVIYFCSMAVSLGGVLFYRKVRGGGGPVGQFSTRRLNPVLLLWAFVLMIAAGVAMEPVFSLLPAPPTEDMGRGMWTVVTMVALAPIFEELICRGIILGSLRAKYGVMTAWFGSALFFGVLHLQPVLVINAFVLGLILGYIYIATQSLWAPIILHAMNNAVAYILMVVFGDNVMLIDLIGSRMVYHFIYFGALVVAAVSAYKIWQAIVRLKEAEKNQAEA